jgi:hypothetical protein
MHPLPTVKHNVVSERKFGWNVSTGQALNRYNAWAAIRKRTKAAGFLTPRWMPHLAGNRHHHLPAERRTAGARQQMAGHESPRTTKLYDRTKDELTRSEVERIRL